MSRHRRSSARRPGGSPADEGPLGVTSDEAARLRLALEMFEDGVALQRQNLKRAHPEESDEQIEQRLGAWLRERPGAEHGDAVGRPNPNPFR